MARRIMICGMLCLVVLCGVSAGCQRERAMSGERARSQYDRFDLLRGRYQSQTKTDNFGYEGPALYERLAPVDKGS